MREKIAIKSSIIGLGSKMITMILSLVVTKVYVQYLGIELKGIDGIFSNVLGFLQLTELGISTAIIYALYQPIVENNIREIQILMHYYKIVYRAICVVILIVGAALIPFLPFFITESTYSYNYLVFIYYLQVISSASTYLLAYKRNLLYADQKQYITTLVDTSVNVLCSVIRIFIIVATHSYVLNVFWLIIQNVSSNLIIGIWCNKNYPYLKEKVTGKYNKIFELKSNVKNIMIGKISGWVYSSTDYLIMSRFVGLILVGKLTNYYTLRNTLTTLSSSIVSPMQPILGNYIRENNNKEKTYGIFRTYTFIRFLLANIITVGFIVMANPVVSVWIGEEYTIQEITIILLAVDIFISITHGPTGELIQVLGLFSDDRNMSIVGTIINLVFSFLLVYPLGVNGVLLGTVMAQCYYWYKRTSIIFREYFESGLKKYIFAVIKYIICIVVEIGILKGLFSCKFIGKSGWIPVLLECSLCVCICFIFIFIWFGKTFEWTFALNMIKRNFIMRKKQEGNNI